MFIEAFGGKTEYSSLSATVFLAFLPDNLEDEAEDDDLFETEFRQYKRTYYMTKMGVDVVSEYAPASAHALQ